MEIKFFPELGGKFGKKLETAIFKMYEEVLTKYMFRDGLVLSIGGELLRPYD